MLQTEKRLAITTLEPGCVPLTNACVKEQGSGILFTVIIVVRCEIFFPLFHFTERDLERSGDQREPQFCTSVAPGALQPSQSAIQSAPGLPRPFFRLRFVLCCHNGTEICSH